MKQFLLVCTFLLFTSAQAQLANGSIAPNFTLTDYYDTTHTLYDYLDSGKTVFLKIFAAHCPSCWNYHQTHRLQNLYNAYGPDSTNELMVLALEYDPYNDSTAFTGNHDPWVTAGDWLTGTPYPIFNVEGADRSVFTAYDVQYYPLIYKICPNRVLERVFTYQTEAQLYQKVTDCQKLSVDEFQQPEWTVSVDQQHNNLILNPEATIQSLRVVNALGQVVKNYPVVSDRSIHLGDLQSGLYMVHVKTEAGTLIEKIQILR